MTDLVQEIQNGYASGWSYTPLNGKKPYLDGWQNLPRPTLTECLDWARRGNVGLRTGLVSGIAVIDIDKPAVRQFDKFPMTPTVLTSTGGFHLYYAVTVPVSNSAGTLGPCVKCGSLPVRRKCPARADGKKCCSHIDVRGDGGQVVSVGSIHPDTKLVYAWVADRTPHNIPFSPFPHDHEWIKAQEKPEGPPDIVCTRPRQVGKGYTAKMLENAYDRVSKAPEGTRNDTLYRTAFDVGGSVGVGIVDYEATRQTLISAGLACGLPRYEVEQTVERGLREGMANPKDMDRQMAANMNAAPAQRVGEFKGF